MCGERTRIFKYLLSSVIVVFIFSISSQSGTCNKSMRRQIQLFYLSVYYAEELDHKSVNVGIYFALHKKLSLSIGSLVICQPIVSHKL